VAPFRNNVGNYVTASHKEPMLLALLTKGPELAGKPVAQLQGQRLVEAVRLADADQVQLVDTLLLEQYTRVLTMALPRSFLVASEGEEWQVQLLDIIDWQWVSNPVLLCDSNVVITSPLSPEATTFEGGSRSKSKEVAVSAVATAAADTQAREGQAEATPEGGREVAQEHTAWLGQEPATAPPEQPVSKDDTAPDPWVGIGLHGDDFSDEMVVVDGDSGWVACPMPARLGVPLMAKRLPVAGQLAQIQLVTRLMNDPATGAPFKRTPLPFPGPGPQLLRLNPLHIYSYKMCVGAVLQGLRQ
jgi:hypothetical protein